MANFIRIKASNNFEHYINVNSIADVMHSINSKSDEITYIRFGSSTGTNNFLVQVTTYTPYEEVISMINAAK